MSGNVDSSRSRCPRSSNAQAACLKATRLVPRLARWKFASAAAACKRSCGTDRSNLRVPSGISPPPARSDKRVVEESSASLEAKTSHVWPGTCTSTPSGVITMQLVGASTICTEGVGNWSSAAGRGRIGISLQGRLEVKGLRGMRGTSAVDKYLGSTASLRSGLSGAVLGLGDRPSPADHVLATPCLLLVASGAVVGLMQVSSCSDLDSNLRKSGIVLARSFMSLS
mmetsp:Transcript_107481/g.302479  ORF Transcript_107481/g.302479 Transcript_107481/m.302479 type:complete len:226 (+) Transcript_107481:1366-2043(+)